MVAAHFIDCHRPADQLAGTELVVHYGRAEGAELRARIGDAPVILMGSAQLDGTLLADCPDLRAIVFLGGSPSSYIDVAAAGRLGIRLRTVVGYGNRSIAEHALALAMAAARDVATMDRRLRAGLWKPLAGIELAGSRLGVVGTGGIGAEMVLMAAALGFDVLAWNRRGDVGGLPCRYRPLDDLLAEADIVSLHLGLNPETRHIVDARRLALMRADAILVNTARGALVDEAALVAALREGRLRHAALDVYEREPLPPDDPLLALENVTLTAHAAYNTPAAARRLLAMGLDLVAEEVARLS